MPTTLTGSNSVASDLGFDVQAPFEGNASGAGLAWNQWGSGVPSAHEPFTDLGDGGPVTQVVKNVAKVIQSFEGEAHDDLTGGGADWFERVHALPRSEIEFGNIISQEDEPYELYNAYRETTVELTSATINIAPGIELPDLTIPSSRGPESSWLDPSSTDNSAGTGLGALSKLNLRATAEGLPTFEGTVDFTFDSGDSVSLTASGSRIVLFPFEHEAPTIEILSFLTDVMESVSGREQRVSLRKNPRQRYQVRYLLDGTDRQRMQALLMEWMDKVFGFPVWQDVIKTTAATVVGATSFSVRGADDVDLRAGGIAVAFTDANTFDVLNISTVTATTITTTNEMVNAYPAGTEIVPLRSARVRRAVEGSRAPANLESFRMEFEAVDNDTGAPTASTAGWNSYNGRVLLDDCNVVSGDMGEQFQRRLYVVDNQTGVINVRSPWDRFKRSHQKTFVARSRSEILSLKRLLIELGGRRKSFYIPTFVNDLTAVADLTSGTATIDIDNIDYVRLVDSRRPKKIFRIEFTDGSSLVRTVNSAASVSSTVERLTLDSNWPANRTVSEIDRIMFYELVRFDTDEFRLEYPRIGLCTVTAPVRAVYDDVP